MVYGIESESKSSKKLQKMTNSKLRNFIRSDQVMLKVKLNLVTNRKNQTSPLGMPLNQYLIA